jgi:hypothetical protein
MIVQFFDSVAGTSVYINPAYVVTFRPDPDDPLHVTIVKLNDGETIRVQAAHNEVAEKMSQIQGIAS